MHVVTHWQIRNFLDLPVCVPFLIVITCILVTRTVVESNKKLQIVSCVSLYNLHNSIKLFRLLNVNLTGQMIQKMYVGFVLQ